jgi:hypothetical protein
MYLKVLPMRRLRCFKVRGKLTPKFIGLFKITKEREEELEPNFFQISFPIRSNLEGEIHFKGGSFVTSQNFKFLNVTKIHYFFKKNFSQQIKICFFYFTSGFKVILVKDYFLNY